MSMGFLIPAADPVAWRGLLIQKALHQLLFEVSWPHLDVLVLDLPPGTGDVQLTILQSIHLAGAALVSTPQTLALRDTVRGLALFRKMDVPLLGLVQNMSAFVCGGCGATHEIFGSEGARKTCAELGLEFLGDVPLHAAICADADAGKPTMIAQPASPSAKAFAAIATAVRGKIGLA